MSDSIDPADQQLIKLLEEKPAEELSFEELDLLRSRLGESPALRTALAKYLQTESYLTQVLGTFTISPEAIISRAESEEAARTRPWQWLAGGVVCLGLIGVLVAVFVNAMKVPEEREVTQATQPPAVEQVDPASTEMPPASPPGETPSAETPISDQPVEPPAAENEKKPAKTFTMVIPAERFAKGSVKVDNVKYGNTNTTVILAGDGKSSAAEYEFNLASGDRYYLHVRYASAEPRPLSLSVNYKKLTKTAANDPTGGDLPAQQKWATAGKFEFKKGKNALRIARDGKFPHVNLIVISTEPTMSDETAPQVEAAVAQVTPWEEALAQPNPPSYLATAFDDFDTGKSLPQVPDILRWFETIPNLQRKIGETHTKVGKCAEFDGVFRLRWPWQQDTALRLSLENHNRLRIHFYDGLQGVTLVYYQDEGSSWGAYVTTRTSDQTHEPATLAIAATDNGRCQRSEMRFGGPIDIRWHAGELILSRGDVVLLRAPLAALPKDVYFDGRTAFHGIAVVPSKDAPAAEPQRPESAAPVPASLAWTEQLTEGAKLIKHPDGSAELVGDNAKGSGLVTAALGNLTPCEVVLEIEGASRGSGVYLAPPKPHSHLALRFAKNTRYNPPLLCAVQRQDELRESDIGYWPERITMLTAPDKQFVRLLSGAGIVRHAISPDGIHWVDWEDPLPNQPGAADLCLHYVSQEPNCRIKLNKISIRPLPALAKLAGDGDLITKVPVITSAKTSSIGQWLAEITTAQPAGIEASVWRRTCALRALAAGCDGELGSRLVQLLLDDAESRQLPVNELLALYQEAFLLLDTRHNGPLAQQCWSRYATVAAHAEQQGLPAYSTVRLAMMTSPVTWRHNLPVADPVAIRKELIHLVYNGQWEAVLDFCKTLRFYQQHQQVPLVEWAEAIAARSAPSRPGADASITRLRAAWRPPLVEELSKDAYNILAEMQAILDSDAFEDAGRMITSISPDAISGVAPHGRDRQLLVSLPSAIRLAVRDYPALRQVMNDKFGPLAQLRVRQSINANNVASVELAAVQFESTEAAAEAHQWLGDRALSSGQFAQASAAYERALRTASTALKHDLQARVRLSAAMQGKEQGTPVTRSVNFGETSIAAGEFEAIIADMKAANASASAQRVVPAEAQRVYRAPAATGYEVAQRSRLDGPTGQDPNSEVTRDINALRIGWCERQITTIGEGNVLYVANRFQLAAYNLDNGQRMWQAGMPGNQTRSRDWTLIPMRPLVAGNVVYIRMLYNAGPMLGAFEKATGKLLWTTEQRHNEFIVSDPLIIQGQLVALTLVRGEQGQSALRLTTFDRDSGEPVVQRNLVRLNEVWWARRVAEVTPINDGLVATLGGLSLCCDINGNLRWIRRPTALPPDEEPSWVRQYVERPLVADGQVFLAQPGVRTVECVEPETGRLVWSKVLPGMESVIGEVDGRVIVRTEQAFLALDAKEGKQLWSHARPDLFDAILLGGDGGLVYVEREPTKANKDRFSPRLVWLDLTTGQAKHTFSLATLEDADPHFGPLVSYKDRLWSFWGRAQNDPNRDFVEMTPKADAPLSPAPLAGGRAPWSLQTDPSLRLPAERLFAGWGLLAGATNNESGLKDGVYGENEVLGICVRGNQPTLFAREIAPAAGAHPKVRMRFNHRTDQDWVVKLSVQFAGQTLWSQDFSKGESPQNWKDLEVDLSPTAGKSGTLVVRADYLSSGGEMPTWWKRLEFVP